MRHAAPAAALAAMLAAVLAALAAPDPARAAIVAYQSDAPAGAAAGAAPPIGWAGAPAVVAVDPAAATVVEGSRRAAAIDCLAKAIAYEAGNEPEAGRQAVAEVVLNRMRHPAFPKSVCGVVFQGSGRTTGCQFTFTCDGSLRRALSRRTWDSALRIAADAIDGVLTPHVGAATHYHATYVSPRWAPSLVRVAGIGAHIFYRFPQAADASAAPFAAGAGPAPLAAANGSPHGFTPWGLAPANAVPTASSLKEFH